MRPASIVIGGSVKFNSGYTVPPPITIPLRVVNGMRRHAEHQVGRGVHCQGLVFHHVGLVAGQYSPAPAACTG